MVIGLVKRELDGIGLAENPHQVTVQDGDGL